MRSRSPARPVQYRCMLVASAVAEALQELIAHNGTGRKDGCHTLLHLIEMGPVSSGGALGTSGDFPIHRRWG
jgi:hypothetical protein